MFVLSDGVFIFTINSRRYDNSRLSFQGLLLFYMRNQAIIILLHCDFNFHNYFAAYIFQNNTTNVYKLAFSIETCEYSISAIGGEFKFHGRYGFPAIIENND